MTATGAGQHAPAADEHRPRGTCPEAASGITDRKENVRPFDARVTTAWPDLAMVQLRIYGRFYGDR
jgi:hypothetical protein